MPYILRPNEFPIAQSVFEGLITSDWFDRSESNEKACAQLVLLYYQSGITVEGRSGQMHRYSARHFSQAACWLPL